MLRDSHTYYLPASHLGKHGSVGLLCRTECHVGREICLLGHCVLILVVFVYPVHISMCISWSGLWPITPLFAVNCQIPISGSRLMMSILNYIWALPVACHFKKLLHLSPSLEAGNVTLGGFEIVHILTEINSDSSNQKSWTTVYYTYT